MKIFLTSILVTISTSVLGQHSQPSGNATNRLDVTNINAAVLTGGDMFRELPAPGVPYFLSFNPAFEVPRGSGIHSIYTAALWIGGKDLQNNLYVSETDYRQNSWEVGYWPGPMGNVHNQAHSTKYDRVWKVSKAQIQAHIQNYRNPWYSVPAEIAEWPGNGNTANGEAALLAPFADLNNDGIYSPGQGDYPLIKGDQALYVILNDKGFAKFSGTPSMNAEIHVMYYGFNDPANGPVYNTLFSEYRIINRGQINLKDFYAGIWVDFDLGNFADDYVGCDTTTNRFFVYNSDNFDEDSVIVSSHGSPPHYVKVNAYGANPPVQSVTFLDQRLSHFMYYNNSQNVVTGQIVSPNDHYNILRGIWKSGAPLTYGGDGTDQTNPPATHMYAGDPVTATGWSERNNLTASGSNAPGDRRGVGSIGPFTLNAGQELKFTAAYTYSRGTSNLNSVTQSQTDAIAIQNFFRTHILATSKPEKQNQPLQLYPNPATEQLTVQLPNDFNNNEVTIKICDYTGRTVLSTTSRQTSINLNIGSLSKGIYQVKVISEDQTSTARFVKQ